MRQRRGKMSVDAFEQLDIIGRGAFGEVRLVRERETSAVYAMKKLRKAEMVLKGQVCAARAAACGRFAPVARSCDRCNTCMRSWR